VNAEAPVVDVELAVRQLSDAELRRLWRDMAANEPPHPLLPLPEEDVAVRCLREGRASALAEALEVRREVIQRAHDDPLYHEPEPPLWQAADKLLEGTVAMDRTRLVLFLAVLGGNRSSKSFYCAKRLVRDAVQHERSLMLCLAEDVLSSIQTQQLLVWHYLPLKWKRLNGSKDRRFSIHYSAANGFSDRRVVLPNGTRILWKTYNESPDEVEGWMFGNTSRIVVGWWADENLRLPWLEMFFRRGRFRPSIGLWSFTPIHGMTPAVKEFIGAGRVLEWREASLLPDRVNVPGGPKGCMPFIQEGRDRQCRVIYFHTELSPFGSGPNGSRDTAGNTYFDAVKQDCEGKSSDYVMRVAYGWSQDISGRRFPKFGPAHVIREEDLPALGTNYMLTDPHGERNWATIWVRVDPQGKLYVYRDWPSAQQYGEWAVPSKRELSADSRKGWDGDPGPAQKGTGNSFWRYKQIWLDEERLPCGMFDGRWLARDPMAVEVLDRWCMEHEVKSLGVNAAGQVRWDEESLREALAESDEPPREPIQLRLADPRALATPATTNQQTGETLYVKFQEEQRRDDGELLAPRMVLLPAFSGKNIETGCAMVNDLLDFDDRVPLQKGVNEPRLYVVDRCQQVQWALLHYTGIDPDGACKDWIDLLRYAVQSRLAYVPPGGPRVTGSVHGPV
jgi:hypothetical protein